MRRVPAALVSVAVAVAGCAPASSPTPPARPGAPLFGRSWRWTDERGVDATFSRWRGTPVVVTGFFTSCTARCPLTVEKLRGVDEALRRRGRHAEFLLVTLDPATDDADRLLRFKESRHLPPTWHLLRGSLEDTRELARWLGLRAAYDDGHIDHDVRVVVFDGTGRVVRAWAGWDFDPDQALAGP